MLYSTPQASSRTIELAAGVSAIAPGVLWLHGSRAIVAADVHFAYEDVIGGALPAWSTAEIAGTLLNLAAALRAREIVLLGDVIHGSRMSEGTARTVCHALASLRRAATLTLLAGNHEGRSRGAAILGETQEWIERDGWLLLHGDRASAGVLTARSGAIIGHLHPSLPLGYGVTTPAFLAGKRIVVVPALTPYSSGLDVFSDACLQALRGFNIASRRELRVVAAGREMLYPFGSLARLKQIQNDVN
jgi:metallophosphoesterase superfamily enzyme